MRNKTIKKLKIKSVEETNSCQKYFFRDMHLMNQNSLTEI